MEGEGVGKNILLMGLRIFVVVANSSELDVEKKTCIAPKKKFDGDKERKESGGSQ